MDKLDLMSLAKDSNEVNDYIKKCRKKYKRKVRQKKTLSGLVDSISIIITIILEVMVLTGINFPIILLFSTTGMPFLTFAFLEAIGISLSLFSAGLIYPLKKFSKKICENIENDIDYMPSDEFFSKEYIELFNNLNINLKELLTNEYFDFNNIVVSKALENDDELSNNAIDLYDDNKDYDLNTNDYDIPLKQDNSVKIRKRTLN